MKVMLQVEPLNTCYNGIKGIANEPKVDPTWPSGKNAYWVLEDPV